MTRARTYPPANTTAQWWETKYARTTMNPVSKLLLHTTETAGWPGYDGGASAPTITYNPWVPAGQRWRQHNYLDRSARALRDPAGTAVRENQDGVAQVEIICYCDPNLYRKYGHGVNALPDHAYEDLGAFLAFLHTEHAVPLVRAPKWSTFPPPDSIRMTGPEYDAFKGVLGHQHASGNTHGDPGMTNAQVDRILTTARRITKPTTGPTPTGALTMTQYDDLDKRLRIVEGRSTGNTDARAQYAYRQVIPGGALYELVQLVANRVTGNTDARAQHAYNELIKDGGVLDQLAADSAEDQTTADAIAALKAQVEALAPAAPKA